MTSRRIAGMTSPAYAEAAGEAPGIIIPLGSVEVLGNHGPLGADLFVADAVSEEIARRSSFLIAPAIPYGDTLELEGWPGTVHVPGDTLAALYIAVARSLSGPGRGPKRVAFLACHSLNIRAADAACRRLRGDGVPVCILDWWKTAFQAGDELAAERPDLFPPVENAPKGHGGDIITSVVMALRPETVDSAAAANEVPRPGLAFHGPRTATSGGPFYTYGTFADYCDTGAWGDVSRASAGKGMAIIRRAADRSAEFLAEFVRNT